MISPNKQFAVIGNPILHSLSPNLFRHVFSEKKIKGNYFRIRPASAERAIFIGKKIGLCGMNVTAPFKEEIAKIANSLSMASKKIGSVNTILFEEAKTAGHNTDYMAVSAFLQGAFEKNQNCIVIGAGGSARASIYAALQLSAKVKIANRSLEKAKKLAKEFGCESVSLEEVSAFIENTAVLIITIPQIEDRWLKEWISPHLTVIDANYQDSSFAQKSKELGCKVFSGKDWLIQQAIPAFTLFTEEFIEKDLFQKSLLEAMPVSTSVISLIGMMGSGKTTIGKELSRMLEYDFIDVDAEIEQTIQKSICEIFEKEGEDVFRKIEAKVLQSILKKSSNVVIATGGGIIAREENRQLLRKKSLCVWLYDDLKACTQRCKNEKTRPLLAENPYGQAEILFEQRKGWYGDSCDFLMDIHEMTPAEASEILYEEIHRVG